MGGIERGRRYNSAESFTASQAETAEIVVASRERAREGQGPLSNHDAYALFLPRHRDAPTRLNVSRDS